MSTRYTKREAAHLLGIDRNTLAKWARECGITDGEDPRDKRLRLLSDDDLLTIRERYADRHTFSVSSADRQHISRVSSADLEARVAELERQVAALLARYDDNLTMDSHTHSYAPVRRVTATTASQRSNSKRPRIPAGMLHQNGWARLHHLPETTVKTHIKDEGVPLEHGEWIDGTTPVKHLLAAEGQAMLHRIFRLDDPCQACGWSSTNETPHT